MNYLGLARERGVGFVLESPTWRASPRWAGELRERLPRLNVLGGCCGTDHRHVAEIRDAWLASTPR